MISLDFCCTSDCGCGGCDATGKARRMVNDAIITAVKDVIGELKAEQHSRAKSHISGLIQLLNGAPESTVQLFEPAKLVGLARDLEVALKGIEDGDGGLDTMHGILLTWSRQGPGPGPFLT